MLNNGYAGVAVHSQYFLVLRPDPFISTSKQRNGSEAERKKLEFYIRSPPVRRSEAGGWRHSLVVTQEGGWRHCK